MSDSKFIVSSVVGVAMQKNPWRVVGIIASRLGVQPASKEKTGGLLVNGAEYVPVYGGGDGPLYDINEVAVALLDRLDAVSRTEKSPTP